MRSSYVLATTPTPLGSARGADRVREPSRVQSEPCHDLTSSAGIDLKKKAGQDFWSIIENELCDPRWHQKLDCASEQMKLRRDKEKDWEGRAGKYLGVFLSDEKRHWKERTKKVRFLWQQVRRRTRLPPKAKKIIVCGQLIPVLCYGCEAFQKPNEEMIRLARQWARWVVGAWTRSSVGKVESLSGIEDLEELLRKKRIRWAA